MEAFLRLNDSESVGNGAKEGGCMKIALQKILLVRNLYDTVAQIVSFSPLPADAGLEPAGSSEPNMFKYWADEDREGYSGRLT